MKLVIAFNSSSVGNTEQFNTTGKVLLITNSHFVLGKTGGSRGAIKNIWTNRANISNILYMVDKSKNWLTFFQNHFSKLCWNFPIKDLIMFTSISKQCGLIELLRWMDSVAFENIFPVKRFFLHFAICFEFIQNRNRLPVI